MFANIIGEERVDQFCIGAMVIGQVAWGVVLALSLHAAFHIVFGS
jgi:hypothetical protein